ncbi:hypothetical protein Tco_1000686 [Tanacetum coccineum]
MPEKLSLCEKLMNETNHIVLVVDVYSDKNKHLLEPDSLPWNGRIQLHRVNIKNDSRLEGLIKCSDLGNDKLPVIIAKYLKNEEKAALIEVLKSHKRAIAWKLSDIKGINPEFCTHKILMEKDYEPTV